MRRRAAPAVRARRGVAVALSVLLAVAVVAAAEQERLERDALELVRLPYQLFAQAARERRAPFDWTTDGCSHTPRTLAMRFDGPCRQHDFAYRNLGHGLRLRAGEAARRWADARFLAELRRRCSDLFIGLRLRGCRGTARAMWTAVRRFGSRWDGAVPTSARERGKACVRLLERQPPWST